MFLVTNQKTMEEIMKNEINAKDVHKVLSKTMLVDGMKLVLDLEKSKGAKIFDSSTETEYLDFFSSFASVPIGFNHPAIKDDYIKKLAAAAKYKPSNSDIYTLEMAKFVDAFEQIAKPDFMKYLFFIEGGSLAVENSLKVAFDWKVKKNFQKGYTSEKGTKIIHFKEAFHGRSGYTLSLTNTDPNKVDFFPKFDWPRITNPKITWPLEENIDQVIELEKKAVAQILQTLDENKDDIAAIIIEPVQAEGGENLFRKEFFQELRKIADENELLLIFDEIQTGMGFTGKWWACEHFDVKPDIICFGKKAQVCGIMVNDRIDDIEDHCFRKSSRINSTWGGNLTDMVRATKYLEIIRDENLVENAKSIGKYLLDNLIQLQEKFPKLISQSRGLGLMCSFDLPDPEIRNEFISLCFENKLIILSCGKKSVRFRTVLDIKKEDIDEGLKIIEKVLTLIDKKF